MSYEDKALRQFKHNDGSGGFVWAYDKDIIDKEIAELEANSIPKRAIESRRNDYMQYLNDCADDDGDKESAQAVFDELEEILEDK